MEGDEVPVHLRCLVRWCVVVSGGDKRGQGVDGTSGSSQYGRHHVFAGEHLRLPLDAAGILGSDTGSSPAGVGSPAGPPCNHHEYGKPRRGALGDAGSCERPMWFDCVHCGYSWCKPCESGRSSKCASCAARKVGDLRAVARSGVPDNVLGMVALVTLTGPGASVIPWDTRKCSHRPDVACSGKLGCRVDRHAAAAWHKSLPRRWSWFVTYLRRLVGDVQYFKVYEWQERGVLHVHALVRVPDGISGKRFVQAVKSCARSSVTRFGPQVDVRFLPAGDVPAEVRPGVQARSPRIAAAGYVAKYCSKGYEDLGSVAMLDVDTGEITSRCVRPWSASRQWGDSMRTCRLRRFAWATTVGCGSAAPTAGPAGGAAARLDPYQNRSTTDPSMVPAGTVEVGM